VVLDVLTGSINDEHERHEVSSQAIAKMLHLLPRARAIKPLERNTERSELREPVLAGSERKASRAM
jgi:hypothetical protein